MLVGVDERVMEQLMQTELLDLIGEENVFLAQPEFLAALNDASLAAKTWIDQKSDKEH